MFSNGFPCQVSHNLLMRNEGADDRMYLSFKCQTLTGRLQASPHIYFVDNFLHANSIRSTLHRSILVAFSSKFVLLLPYVGHIWPRVRSGYAAANMYQKIHQPTRFEGQPGQKTCKPQNLHNKWAQRSQSMPIRLRNFIVEACASYLPD